MSTPADRRKYERYDTKVEIYFRVAYDVTTKVKFRIKDDRGRFSARKYPAVSRNVSAEGLSFISSKELSKKDRLYVEIYLPESEGPLVMEGEVRWCVPLSGRGRDKKMYEAGVKISSVQGQSVANSIYYDNTHQIIWSILLESVLGNFRIISEKLAGQRSQKKSM